MTASKYHKHVNQIPTFLFWRHITSYEKHTNTTWGIMVRASLRYLLATGKFACKTK